MVLYQISRLDCYRVKTIATELGYQVTSNQTMFKILRIISNSNLNIETNLLPTHYLLLYIIEVLASITLSLRCSPACDLDSLILQSIIQYSKFWTILY